MRIRRVALPVMVLASLALLAAACGDDDDGASSTTGVSEDQATETPVSIVWGAKITPRVRMAGCVTCFRYG